MLARLVEETEKLAEVMSGDSSEERLDKRLKAIEAKIDTVFKILEDKNELKDFGLSLLANVVGNMVDSGRR